VSYPAPSVEPAQIPVDDSFFLDGPPRPEDASAHRLLAVDPEAARFLGWTIEQARSQADSHYDDVIVQFRREWQEGRIFSFIIRRSSNGEAIGAVELRPTGDGASLSYVVAAKLRGRGVATRAVSALLAWAAKKLAVRHIDLTCHAENAASRRVAEKCRFTYVGRTGDELRFRRDLTPS
jgi:RimJ/RimL family protein N-acetyltransferase